MTSRQTTPKQSTEIGYSIVYLLLLNIEMKTKKQMRYFMFRLLFDLSSNYYIELFVGILKLITTTV